MDKYGPLTRADRILVTGATGMVGKSLVPKLQEQGLTVLAPSREELDLLKLADVHAYFAAQRPSAVIALAAKVGGIQANMNAPISFLEENLLITLNTYKAAQNHGVRKVIFLGSSCMYPRRTPQPMLESDLETGPLEPTNEGYALAKIVGVKIGQMLTQNGKLAAVNLIPPNLYGPEDTFDLDQAHVLPSLVRRLCCARATGAPSVTLWGSGNARREFLHTDDLCEGILWADRTVPSPAPINLGSGVDISIHDLAHLIRNQIGYTGAIHWDRTRPDGMSAKLMDSSRAFSAGWRPKKDLKDGIREVIAAFWAQPGQW